MMQNKVTQANWAMIAAKTMSGLNINALKMLLPLWIAPVTGVTIRICFGAVMFWIFSIFTRPDVSTVKEKVQLFLLGAVCIYGFMYFYLIGLSLTTPVCSAIFSSLQPIWVFLLMAVFQHEKVTVRKVIGIAMGFGGAILCIITQQSSGRATDLTTGYLFNFICSLIFAVYLVVSARLLKHLPNMVVLRWAFLGASCSAVIVNLFYGFEAPLFSEPVHWQPMLALVFVLIFPTTLSYLLIPIGLKYLNTTLVSIYGYLMLVVATVASFVLGQDEFSWMLLLSLLLIIYSVYWMEMAEKEPQKEVCSGKITT